MISQKQSRDLQTLERLRSDKEAKELARFLRTERWRMVDDDDANNFLDMVLSLLEPAK